MLVKRQLLRSPICKQSNHLLRRKKRASSKQSQLQQKRKRRAAMRSTVRRSRRTCNAAFYECFLQKTMICRRQALPIALSRRLQKPKSGRLKQKRQKVGDVRNVFYLFVCILSRLQAQNAPNFFPSKTIRRSLNSLSRFQKNSSFFLLSYL